MRVSVGYCLMLSMAIGCGAWTGLYLSALSQTRSEAGSRLLATVLVGVVAWAVAWGAASRSPAITAFISSSEGLISTPSALQHENHCWPSLGFAGMERLKSATLVTKI